MVYPYLGTTMTEGKPDDTRLDEALLFVSEVARLPEDIFLLPNDDIAQRFLDIMRKLFEYGACANDLILT